MRKKIPVKRGKMVYVPHKVLVDIDKILEREECKRKADAFNKMANDAKIGREVERIYTGFFGKRRRKKKR